MAYYKLKEESPLVQKVRQVEDLMGELGIYVSVGVNGQLFINHEGKYYQYRDVEQDVGGYDTTQDFPLGMETKLVIEKDYFEE